VPAKTLPSSPRLDTREWEKIDKGLWWQVGTTTYKSIVYEGGQERKVHLQARTRTEAKQQHNKRKVNVREGIEPVAANVTLDEHADDFWSLFEGLVASGERAASTLERYRIQYRVHISPKLGKLKVQAIRPEHVSRWLSDLRRQGLDVASIYSILSLLMSHGITRGLIVETPLKRLSPAERPKRRPKTRARRLTDQECSDLIAMALPSTRTLIALYAFTGLRQSEALGLVWSNFDSERGVLHVERQLARKKRNTAVQRVRLKSERGEREVLLDDRLVTLLKQHKAEAFARGHATPEDFIFSTAEGNPLFYRNVTRDLGKAADRAGLNEREDVPKLSTHDLRHTAISRWIASGLDVVTVARMAGDHPDVILRVYAGDFERAKREDEIRAKIAAGTSIRLRVNDALR
jgi:integrase